jgi:hypothetical protein
MMKMMHDMSGTAGASSGVAAGVGGHDLNLHDQRYDYYGSPAEFDRDANHNINIVGLIEKIIFRPLLQFLVTRLHDVYVPEMRLVWQLVRYIGCTVSSSQKCGW